MTVPSMTAPSTATSTDRGVVLARVLLLGVIVSMLVSTSLAVVLEVAAYLAFAVAPELRRRLAGLRYHPLATSFVAFAAVVVLATFYGLASWHDALLGLVGWRRILLLPLAAAVFDDQASKRLMLQVVVLTGLAGALGELIGFRLLGFTQWRGPDIIFRNHTIQGMAISLATITCFAALLRPKAFAGDWLLGNRLVMMFATAFLVFEIMFILEARSGYVVLSVMMVVIVVLLVRGTRRAKLLAGLGVLACVGVILATSGQVRDRVGQAIDEVASIDEASIGTSSAIRVILWRNSIRMIRDHPIFGVGTGGFQEGYRPYVDGVSGWQGHLTDDPHNQFLKILGEQGIIGLAALLFFIFRVLTCPAPTPYRELAAAVLIGWCATSLVNSHFSTFVESRLLFFWLGAMLAEPTMLNGTTTQDRL
jgi:O-antigen ligase